MRVVTTFNNFSWGKIDHELNGRFDLPIYSTGSDVFRNFYSNFKGNAIYRNGFENMLKDADCAFMEFRFNNEQNYLIIMTNLKMRFLTYDTNGNFGFVQSGGADLEVVTPYSLAESKEIAKRHKSGQQSGDIMYICHPTYAPRKLTRVSATSFTLATYVRTADPFTGANAYPTACCLYDGAAYFINTNNEKTTIWRSQIGDFDNMTTGTGASDGFKVTVASLTEPIEWIGSGANSLIAGSSQGLIPINGGDPSTAITPSNVTTKISDVDGSSDTMPVRKESLLFYINASQRNLNYFNYDIIQESFQSKDANQTSYDITKGKIEQLVYKKDRNNLLWSIRESKDLVSLNFDLTERIVGWHDHTSQADITQISRMSDNEGNVQLFGLLKYGTDYFICRMSEETSFPLFSDFYTGDEDADKLAYVIYISELLKTANHLDISTKVEKNYTTTITYVGDTAVDSEGVITSTGTEFLVGNIGNRIYYKTATGREAGIFEIIGFTDTDEVEVKVLYPPTSLTYADWYLSFNTLSGLTDFIGEEMTVVADGGDMGQFTVTAGATIALGKEVTVAWVGFNYEGLIKTFGLGFAMQNGVNTQITNKSLYRSHLRMIFSAGGQIGTSPYRMQPIQAFSPQGYFDLPPLPIDGTSEPITYSDESEKDKYLYFKQTKSLPMQITAAMNEVDYVGNL